MLVSAFLMSVVSFILADALPSIELRLARDDCTCTSKQITLTVCGRLLHLLLMDNIIYLRIYL